VIGVPTGPDQDEGLIVGASGLCRRFGDRVAVDGVDIRVHAGERVALLGPNGAGKSTLLRMIATLLRPDEGELVVCGSACPRDAQAARGRIGLLGHEPMVYRDLSARQNLELFATLHGVADAGERAMDALQEVGLLARAHDPVATFSRGMAQRLGLARVLLPDPDLLLLDEPYSGLDAQGTALLDARLRAGRVGRATILVTHEVERGVFLADRAVVLRAGRVVLDEALAGVDPARFRRRYEELVR
jgi:heme exporter protein A